MYLLNRHPDGRRSYLDRCRHLIVLPLIVAERAFSWRNPIVTWKRNRPPIGLMLVSLVAVFTWGCFHPPTPYLPDHWPGAAESIEALSDRAGRPVLQVIIAYNIYWPNHTALRLVPASGKTLFWDPGGGYGKTQPQIVRHSDLIMENAPDLAAYMIYRWTNNDQAVEIFEWELSAAEARRFLDTLLEGAGRSASRQAGFRTATPGFFCNAAVSSFLYHYGRPSIQLGDSYLLPNLLARDLYLSPPDRVMILKRELRPAVLVLHPPDTHRDLACATRDGPFCQQPLMTGASYLCPAGPKLRHLTPQAPPMP